MSRTFSRVLLLVVCGMTVLPPGWCCRLGALFASSSRTPAAIESSNQPARPLCCGCCPVEEPSAEAEMPLPVAPRPAPTRASCCTPVPAEASRTVEIDPAPAIVLAWLTVPPAQCHLRRESVAVPFYPLDPPLHCRLCVWIC